MTYGVKVYKNGKRTGELLFSTGKRVFLNTIELQEFQNKVDYWRYTQYLPKKELSVFSER